MSANVLADKIVLNSLSIASLILWSEYLIISLRIPSGPQALFVFRDWMISISSCSVLG